MKSKLEKMKDRFFVAKPNDFEWAAVITIIVIIFCTMYYSDNSAIFSTHFYEVEALFAGTSLGALGSTSLPYGILHQWICELWILPISLLYHLFGLSFDSIFVVLWCKLCIALFFLLSIKELGVVAKTLGMKTNQIKWMCFFYTTSLLVVLPVFHIAQTDALYIWIMLKGMNSLLKRDTKGFLFWFAIAVSFKTFTLFLFIPLLLLEEKRILYIIRNAVCGGSVLILQQIWYRIVALLDGLWISLKDIGANATSITDLVQLQCAEYASSMSHSVMGLGVTETARRYTSIGVEKTLSAAHNIQLRTGSVASAMEKAESRAEAVREFYSQLLETTLFFEIPAIRKGEEASLLVVLFGLLCIWCYLQKQKDDTEWMQICIYVAAISLALFFITASPMPYWIVIFYPFLLLLIYMNEEKLQINLLLEKLFTITTLIVYVRHTYWVYGGAQNFDKLFLTKWGIIPSGHEYQGGPNIKEWLNSFAFYEWSPLIAAICLVSILGIFWINHPKSRYSEGLTKEGKIKVQHGFALFSVVLLYAWYILSVVVVGSY